MKEFFLYCLKELSHHILSHFFDGQNYGLSDAKPKNEGFLREKKHQRGDSKAKRNKDGKD